MSEKSIKRVKCPKCGTEKETSANTTTACANPECKHPFWIPSNLVSGQIDAAPTGEKKIRKEKPVSKAAVNEVLMLDRTDVLAAQVLVDALNKGELCVGCAEIEGSGALCAVLCEYTDGATIVHATLITPDSETKFSKVVPVMTL